MSKIEVDTIDTQASTTLQVGDTNTATINLGKTGDAITVPAGTTTTQSGATNVPSGGTVSIQTGGTLTIDAGATITNNGTASGFSADLTNLSATNLTSGTVPDARFPATLPAIDGSNLTNLTVNLTGLTNDISTLALHQATNANASRYNLTNTNVDVYQDSATIANLTDVARDSAGEYVSTYGTSTATDYDQTLSKTRTVVTQHTGTWTNAITNDAISRPAGSGGQLDYPSFYINWIYDLATDWKIRIFVVVKTTGAQTYENYACWNSLVTTDTSAAAGEDTATASVDGRVFRNKNASSGTSDYLLEPTEWKTSTITSAYGTLIGTDGATDNYGEDGFGHQVVDCSTGSIHMQRCYAYAQNSYGWDLTYDRAANTIVIKGATDAGFTTFGSNYTTYTNVPSTGRFLLAPGSGGSSTSNYYSTTYDGVLDADKGNAQTTTVTTPATGSYESTAQTANASTTVVSAVVTYTDAFGTTALDTDLILEVSADNGATWQNAALTAAGTFSTGVLQAVANDVTVAAGTQIKYKISFANQSASVKVTRVNGVSLIY